jgi:hypothetical protein
MAGCGQAGRGDAGLSAMRLYLTLNATAKTTSRSGSPPMPRA